ncbi:hypothetical protein [Brevundimonas nasdae]|jgi:uncharacterized membrane protein|uniref:Transmembrane protein n=1 Tax=Brevundimonas nasdae TaxID=172043 RepID=A0ABX8TCS5_9CAUL|nr:hypothetical protein [Brevundimonas nasdae]QYC08986.1 hypothetical protein KWG56_10075 [Brevundimonas nasdae]QYC15036.1 hypothetical protein KWG63_05410 [Brevundimonas nasdae]
MTTQPNFTSGQEPEGKVGALIAWALFLLSIPSANVLVLVGLVVSYVTRNTAVGVARQHIEAQIALFWSVFWWTIAAWVAIIVSAIASVVLVGIPFLILSLLIWFLISVWFTVKSALGLINLLQNKPI